MAIQTQCRVLLVIFVTITAGVPAPSKHGEIAAASNCPPCRLPKNIDDSCIERILTRINTGEICLYCINRCRSRSGTSSAMSGTAGTSRSALTRNPLKTNSIVSTKSKPRSNKKSRKSKSKRKSSKMSKSDSKRKSSKMSKSDSKRKFSKMSKSDSKLKSSRRRKNSKKSSKRSKSKTTSAKIATGMQAHVIENKIVTNTAIKPQKTPSLQLSYGESPPEKVAPIVPSVDTQMAQEGKAQWKKPQTLSRGSRVRSMPRQSRIIDPYADQPLIQQGAMSRPFLSRSNYRRNRGYGDRRHRQMSYGRRMFRQGFYPDNHGYYNHRPRTWDDSRSYDDGYNARQTDDMSNDNDSGNDNSGNDSHGNDNSGNDSHGNDSGNDSRDNDSGDDYGRRGYKVPKRPAYNGNYRRNNDNFSSGGGESGSSSENRSDR